MSICREQHFGITGRLERVTQACELCSQLQIVVYRAVEDDHVSSVVAFHRLMAGFGEIEDREATKPERDAPIEEEPDVVGPTMRDELRHPRD